MKWVNPPVAYMLHAGAPLLMKAGVHIPGMQRGDKTRVALEAYPGYLARKVLNRASYKSDDPKKDTADRRMARSEKLPQTSQPPAGDFRRLFEHVLAYQPGAVYVGLSRPLSGTLQAAETAARGFTNAPRIFDSGHASAGEALLAWRAGEMADAGADAAAIDAELVRLKPLTQTWAMARDISHAVRGGRIPRWAEPVVRFSGLLPIAAIKPDGRLAVAGGLIARKRASFSYRAWRSLACW